MSTGDGTVVTDNREESRFEIVQGDDLAELVYQVDDRRLLLLHTEVPTAFRGQGTGGRLVSATVARAASDGLTIVPWCPYARRWLHEHPEEARGVAIDFDTPPSAG